MTALIVIALLFGVLGAGFSAAAGVTLYRGRTRETQPGIYSIPAGDRKAFVFTVCASGCTGLAVILSAVAALCA